MGSSSGYPNVPVWTPKPEGYQKGSMVKYQGNIFKASFWASEPGTSDPDHNGWRLYDELYDVTPHTPANQAKIIGYLPSSRAKEGFQYNAVMYQNITHAIMAFLTFSETALGEFDSASLGAINAIKTAVVSTAHLHGTYVSVALGGANDYGFLYLMERVGANPGDPVLQKAVSNVVDFVKSNGLDGVDLDLECWWDKNGDPNKDQGGRLTAKGPHPAGIGLVEFAKQLKLAMPAKIVSSTIFATSWYGNNYDPRIAVYVDWIAVMTYDLTGAWNQSPVGPHTDLIKIRDQTPYVGEQQGPWPASRPAVAK